MKKAEKTKRLLNINLSAILKNVYSHHISTSEAYQLIMEDIKLYADEQKEKYAYQQAMAYEEWLNEKGYTQTISARPDYLDFFNQQK